MSRLFRRTLAWLSVLGLPILLFFSLSNFFVSPAGTAIGLVFAALYLVLVIWLLRRSPMWPDPSGAGWLWVAACLVWGAGVSFLLVMLSGPAILALTEKWGLELTEASFGGAYPEEIGKALGVGVILFSFRALNRPWHGLITGALVGLGFEAIENVLYGAIGAVLDPNSDINGTLWLWAVRLLAGPGLHIVLSALAGWGLGLAIFSAQRSTWWRVQVAGGWLAVAFLLHFAWNLMWPQTWMLIANYLAVSIVMYPLFIWVWVRAHRDCVADDSYAYTSRSIATLSTK
ncbi:PrsW family intramembrane metalloprotease [Corynebacterium alimapuense]|uniref:PrsW family intramembrane metalloprotease n=1 Tax=Corynebacterium alimapuense TaxID=1576874 RepID=A0A3M8K4S8_9CORY|nr:PrsW family intramembrane metalloprotease [Corynebacterium alimapuense]RNE48211.1 PrsW family intramembrane metalloprotease [Corynebacterium alimapuense]